MKRPETTDMDAEKRVFNTQIPSTRKNLKEKDFLSRNHDSTKPRKRP